MQHLVAIFITFVVAETVVRVNAPDSSWRPTTALKNGTRLIRAIAEFIGTQIARLTDLWRLVKEYIADIVKDAMVLVYWIGAFILSPTYVIKGYVVYYMNSTFGYILSACIIVVICIYTVPLVWPSIPIEYVYGSIATTLFLFIFWRVRVANAQ